MSLLDDLRYSTRTLLKHPGFVFTITLILALGIGANSAIFSVVSAVLLRPLPYEDPDRIVMIWETNVNRGLDRSIVSPANFLDWRDRNHSFEQIAAWRFWFYNLSGTSEPERIHGVRASASFFPLLGVKPTLGRNFLPEEEQVGHDRVVILSHGLWQRRFGGNPDIIGQPVRIDGEPFTVVGVLPSSFRFIRVLNGDLDLWMPFAFDPAQIRRDDHSITVYARLKQNVGLSQAQAEMDTVTLRLAQEHPDTNSGWGAQVIRLHDQYTGFMGPILLMLLGVVVFVLLIACANVANLLLSRATAREREIAIRAALGASRSRLIRQLLTESLLLALLGGAAGLLVAHWGVGLLNALLPEGTVFRLDKFSLDLKVLAFTLIISLFAGVIFGLAPGLQTSNANPNESLREGGRSLSGGAGGRRLRDLLVIAEVALAVMLLIGAGLMISSSLRLQGVDRGLKLDNLLTMQVSLPKPKYATGEQMTTFYEQVLERIKIAPGIQAASAVNFLPFSGLEDSTTLNIEGRPTPPPGEEVSAPYRVVDYNYFRTIGIPLLRGRYFTPEDKANSLGVVVISETMADRFWPNENPLGRRLKPDFAASSVPWRPEANSSWLTVIGVVGNVKEDRFEDKTSPEIYLSYLQYPLPLMTLIVRSQSDPNALTPAVRGQVWAVDKELPVYNIKTMDEVFSESFASWRAFALLQGTFAAVALMLATLGIYSVMAYSVTQRTHEIGIRMALGAQPRDVLRMIVGQGLKLALVGVAVGVPTALAVTRVISNLLFGVIPTDPPIFVVVPLLLVVIAMLASYFPARRALKVDPMIALRNE